MINKQEQNEQCCLFCNRKDIDMPVYSCCLGRLGICLDCAEKAQKALLDHQEKSKEVRL